MKADFPLPDTEWEPTRPFWEAAARGELRIPRCEDCGAWNWYPPERCRACDSQRLAWARTSGRGTLFSFARVERAWVAPFGEWAPYATGLVALEEDPAVRVVTRIVDCDPASLRVDMPVRVVFRPLAFSSLEREVIAPMFAPVPDGQAEAQGAPDVR
jgi:uncharacterized OB-fold protein